uniref:CTL-5 n=1 Tax=Portunus trituberculatus TaxID=210409 RepID=A0A977SQF5_PORTR|nr:CTL-5 [Portunus trituberculatus]
MKWITTLAVAAAAVGFSSTEDVCPPPFTNYDPGSVVPKCLTFLSSAGTWSSMLEVCKMMSGSLAVVNDDLHNIVYKHIINTPALTDKCFWIGGTDKFHEGTWVWEHDGSEIPLGGPHWDPCEPEPNGDEKENSLAICPSRYYYKDYPSDREHHGICQYFP